MTDDAKRGALDVAALDLITTFLQRVRAPGAADDPEVFDLKAAAFDAMAEADPRQADEKRAMAAKARDDAARIRRVTISDDEIDEVLAGLDCMLDDPRAWLDPVPEAELDDAERAQLAVVERLRERLTHELTAELRGAEIDQVLAGLRLLCGELARSPLQDGEDVRLLNVAELVARLDRLRQRTRND